MVDLMDHEVKRLIVRQELERETRSFTYLDSLVTIEDDYSMGIISMEWASRDLTSIDWVAALTDWKEDDRVRQNDQIQLLDWETYMLIRTSLNDSILENQLIPAENLATLYTLAGKRSSLAGSRARSLLNFYYDEQFRLPILPFEPEVQSVRGRQTWEEEVDPFNLYPSVANNKLSIEQTARFEQKIQEIEILDLSGRSFLKISVGNNQRIWTIDCADWPSASYIVLLKAQDQLFYEKLEVRH